MSDFLIIGGGLAGILTAFNLYRKDRAITINVVDNSFPNAAWKAAAGIINPVSGKRVVKTVNAEEILSRIHQLNNTIHEQTGKMFFHPKPILRIFRDNDELKFWNKKIINTDEYKGWIEDCRNPENLSVPYGSGIIHKGGYLHITGLLHTICELISDRVTFTQTHYSHSNNSANDYTKGSKVLMCYGWEMMYNPLWSFLPFAPFKGEVLTVKMPTQLSDDYILNNGTYFLPINNGTARIGATIEHDTLDYIPTEHAKNHLLDEFYTMSGIIPEIIEHKVGIRPGIEDRYPVIGQHPEHKHIYILNGLGGRGAFYAPYCAALTADLLLNNTETPSMYSVSRYYHRYR